jgi:hypothetical protein
MDCNILFYCKTPLQALIINNLLKESAAKSVVVYIPNNQNNIHEIYFNKINTSHKIFIPYDPISFSDTLTKLRHWFRIPRSIRKRSYQHIYFASIGSQVLKFFAGRSPSANFYLFDDGSFNLHKKFFFQWVDSYRLIPRIIDFFFMGERSSKTLKKVSIYYTIFPISWSFWTQSPIKKIDLFLTEGVNSETSNLGTSLNQSNRRVRIFLGSYFVPSESSIAASRARSYNFIVNNSHYDVFIPHPGNQQKPHYFRKDLQNIFKDLPYSTMIAEEIILQIIQQGYQVNLYGFNSTVLYNLASKVPSCNIILDELMMSEDMILPNSKIRLLKGF